jgi:DNA-binding PucR family transcriptional regulator
VEAGHLCHPAAPALGATSAALHVHRNTLAYRLRRIQEIAGLDFDDPRDLARVYLVTSPERPGT